MIIDVSRIQEVLPELVVASISIGFCIATLIDKDRENDFLPIVPLLISFTSSIAALIRHKTNVAMGRHCVWKRQCEPSSSRQNMVLSPESSSRRLSVASMGGGSDVADGENIDEIAPARRPSISKGAIRQSAAIFCNPWITENYTIDDTTDESGNTDTTTAPNDNNDKDGCGANKAYDRNNARFRNWVWNEIVKSFLQTSNHTLLLLHGPALSLLLYLTARLFAVDNFRTRPIHLDFGHAIYYGTVEADDGSHFSNRAFASRSQAPNGSGWPFLRASCGFAAAFLGTPAVSGSFARLVQRFFPHRTNGRGPVLLTTLLHSIASTCPAYNLIRRFIIKKKEYKEIASSSYPVECFEWIVGYIVGIAVGMLVTSVSGWFLLVYAPGKYEGGVASYMETFRVKKQRPAVAMVVEQQREESAQSEMWNDDEVFVEEKEEEVEVEVESNTVNTKKRGYNYEYAFGKIQEYRASEPKTQTYCGCCRTLFCNACHVDLLPIVNTVSIFFLSVFALSTFVGGICLGATWNSCEMSDGAGGGDDDDDCINSRENGMDMNHALLYVFIVVFGVIEGVFYWFVRCRPVHKI